MLFDEIDRFGKLAWVSLIIIGFWVAWPVGLAILAIHLGRKKLGYSSAMAGGRWCNAANSRRFGAPWGRAWARAATGGSGNAAFDDYRDETLRRLEEEEREFQEFLDRLRKARDKSEFDAFMAERRNRGVPTATV